MIFIPTYVLVLIPILTTWWVQRRAKHREYRLLAFSFFAVVIPLLILAHFRPSTTTWYGGPLAATGIMTFQIPLSMIISTSITVIPMTMKFVRGFLAILAGEIPLFMIAWIS